MHSLIDLIYVVVYTKHSSPVEGNEIETSFPIMNSTSPVMAAQIINQVNEVQLLLPRLSVKFLGDLTTNIHTGIVLIGTETTGADVLAELGQL